MQKTDAGDLSRTLLRLNLITQKQLDECLNELRQKSGDAGALLGFLERKGHLTSYQVGQLRKADTSALVVGNYALLYHNASGSFARVYRARSLRDGQMVGMKVLRQRWAKDPKSVIQFRREAELLKKLKHENIVPIYEVGQDGEQYYLTMEFVEGGNLRDFINIRKQLSPAEATKCTLDLALGLQYALSQGLTHRDMKMTNVLMNTKGVAKLVDFGLASIEAADGSSSAGESEQRAIEYATLEKGTGAPRNDPRSDLYFLGAIYYELLTGIPPLPRTRDRLERGQFSRYSGVRPISQANPALPRAVTKIVERLMQVNPAARYQTAGEVAVELRAALAELKGAAPGSGVLAEKGAPAAPAGQAQPVILCIESRTKHQDALREYLTKHGFRVLMLSDPQRAINRVRDTPPDCALLMGEAAGDDLVKAFEDLRRAVAKQRTLCVLVLGSKQTQLKSSVSEGPNTLVLTQPVTLRDLRKEIKRALSLDQQPQPQATSQSPTA
jgi:CheY-like chemotaxis protein/predicted Ser/Thr protein kinase